MAWNTPGSSGSDNNRRNPQRGNGGNPFDRIPDSIRGLFGDGAGGGNIGRWAVIVLVLWLAFNCFVLVAEQQRGVVLRFGQMARVMQPGPHFKWPWPVERVFKVNATTIKTFSDTVPVLTSDENIVSVEVNVQYRVADPEQYLFATRDADQVLQQATLSAVREQIGRSDLDTVLSARGPLSISAKLRLEAALKSYHTGLAVTELNLPNARPPEEVKPAFDDVNSAQQDQQRLTSEAKAYAAKIVPEARGQAARVRTVAEGYKAASIAKATGDSERFTLLQQQYENAPEVTRKRLWLETLQDVLSRNRKVIGGDGRQLIYVPMQGATAAGGPPVLPADIISPTVESNGDTARSTRSPRPARGQGDDQ